MNNGVAPDENAFEFCTRVENAQLPKVVFMGASAATGALADDHDVLEFLTYSYIPRQVTPPNQAATDEQSKKYKEEYEKYEQELKQQQQNYQKEHPDATTPINEQQLVCLSTKYLFKY